MTFCLFPSRRSTALCGIDMSQMAIWCFGNKQHCCVLISARHQISRHTEAGSTRFMQIVIQFPSVERVKAKKRLESDELCKHRNGLRHYHHQSRGEERTIIEASTAGSPGQHDDIEHWFLSSRRLSTCTFHPFSPGEFCFFFFFARAPSDWPSMSRTLAFLVCLSLSDVDLCVEVRSEMLMAEEINAFLISLIISSSRNA